MGWPQWLAREPDWLARVLLVGIVIVLYWGTLSAGFSFDDLRFVVDNPKIRSWDKWSLWTVLNRSVRALTLRFDYELFGDDPAGYHAHNVAWHAIAVVLFQSQELAATILIGVGVVMLMQPYSIWLFGNSFTVILIGTIGFVIVSHFPEA